MDSVGVSDSSSNGFLRPVLNHSVVFKFMPPNASAEKAHDLLEAMLEAEEVYPFHVDLIKHGRRTCLAQRPRCPQCPLRRRCPSASSFYPTP